MFDFNRQKINLKKKKELSKEEILLENSNKEKKDFIRPIKITDIKEKRENEERIKLLNSMIEKPKLTVNDSCFTHNFRLPSHLRKLSKIFTALISIDKFNKSKEIVTIFHNSKKCIENIINQEVTENDIQILNSVYPEAFHFTKVKVNYENKEINSFVINLKEYNTKELEKRLLNTNNLRNKPLFEEEIKESKRIKKEITYNEKSLSILERIKLKKKLRKETFVKHNSIDFAELKEKIKQLFLIENKKSIEKSKIIEVCKLYNGNEKIENICNLYPSEFEIKIINRTEYLIYKSK